MKSLTTENFSQYLADREEQKKLFKSKNLEYTVQTVARKDYSGTPPSGWDLLDDTLKTVVKLSRLKSVDEYFEDKVWCLLYKMGFKYLSKSRDCRISYGSKEGSSQQVDVFAVDDECAFIVECKSSNAGTPIASNFKSELEAIEGRRAGINGSIKKLFQVEGMKVGYIFATQNYRIGNADHGRMENLNVKHFGEPEVEYYQELAEHIGSAARYQLEADLFAGQKIPSLDNQVYAIKGSMGGMEYYSFCIEPERLLKFGFVLHRSQSVKILPSYQRLIKKSRLTAVRKFIDEGGYFPNSLIVSMELDGKAPSFQPTSNALEDSETKVGILKLPAKYRSLYIIDGQHRLYGYSDSEFASKNTVPVVAFASLERKQQLRLFMEINENQKAVSANLRHTLGADLKFDAENLRDRADGLKKTLAQELGEDPKSPLFGLIRVGEDKKTDIRVVTLNGVLAGLNLTKFVGKFTKDKVTEQGQFNLNDSEQTVSLLKEILVLFFSHLASELPDEWSRLQKDQGILATNDGITSAIAILGDIIDHMVKFGEVSTLSDKPVAIIDKVKSYTVGMILYYKELSETDRLELRQKYGRGAPARLRRILQSAIRDKRDDFQPDGLDDYWRDQSKQFNNESFSRISDIEAYLKEEVKERLFKLYGNTWLKKGIKGPLYVELNTLASKKNLSIEDVDDEKGPWDCLHLINYRDIMTTGSQWSSTFQKDFSCPGTENKNKDEKTKWLVKLGEIRNTVTHGDSVSQEEAGFVQAVHEWLILEDQNALKALNK